MDIRGAVDAAVPTNIIAAKAAEVRANKVNWQSYLQWVHLHPYHFCFNIPLLDPMEQLQLWLVAYCIETVLTDLFEA